MIQVNVSSLNCNKLINLVISGDVTCKALRIANDLERVGDLAENIAKRVPMLIGEINIDEATLQLERMSQLVREQLTRVLRSYAQRDVTEAMAVWPRIRKSTRSIPRYSGSS